MGRIDGERRREEVLDAALVCFAERGVVATGIEEIRKRANASPSSIYHLFASTGPGGQRALSPREAILLALLARTFTRLFAHLAARVTKTKTAESAVLRLVEAHIDWVLANAVEARVMYQAMVLESQPPPTTSARTRQPKANARANAGADARSNADADMLSALADRKAVLLAPLVAHFGRFIAAGELPRWSPLLLDVVLLGTAHEACRRWLGGAPLDARWMRRELPRLAWRSLRGP